MLAVLACPHVGYCKLLQLPSIVLNGLKKSHFGLGKHWSARFISCGCKNPMEVEGSIKDLEWCKPYKTKWVIKYITL